ncbi:AAA family ATPase [Nocardia sp. alder85J]|uniref:AAA family ATPase n=1 Tax=Nocardia sp. alder85J TaxID=2862949 RepID=UPI001CD6EA3B|nr:AAA family ATPase [Nocardia sp. alder85J]MCX4097619.1 AAA family ATPase [Nocardia sp. alder85J]
MTEQRGFIREVRIDPSADERDGYPFDLPVVAALRRGGGLRIPPGAIFLVGENGSGKSTLLEAIAVATGFNPEGGSQNFRFATRSTESELGDHLRVSWGTRKPRTRFFLRAESFYNVATEIERIPGLAEAGYGGVRLHERSHGESFVALMRERFGPDGLYLLDEPEAALSPRGCLAVLARFAELIAQRCQLIVATHSPILLALPGATIYQIGDDGGIDRVAYDDALPVQMTRDFLAAPERYLRYLLESD